MPTTLKILLYTTAACMSLFGFMLYQVQPATQQAVAQRQQTAAQQWAAKSMAELDQKAAAQARSDHYEACCARG